jgi:hypothetical protein
MSGRPPHAASLLGVLLAVLLGGCAGGLVGPLPVVMQPNEAANVTIFRDGSPVGFIGPIMLWIDGRRTWRVWPNQRFSFRLDPGQYIFYFTIGLNECRRVASIQPRQDYLFRLAPNCIRFDGPF